MRVGHEQRDDRAAVLVAEALHLDIDLAPLRGVELRAGLDQQLVELLVLPLRLVPVGTGRVDLREHPVLRRTSAPVAGDPGLHQPDVGPVAVVGLAHGIDRDAGGLGRLDEKLGHVDRALEGGIGDMEVERETIHAGLLQMELRLLGIIGALRDLLRRGAIDVGRTDRVVVADFAVALDDLLEGFLAVDRVLQRQADVVVIVRRLVGQHRQGAVLVAVGREDLDIVQPLEQVDGLEIQVRHRVDLTAAQGVGAGGDIGDEEVLHRVEVGAALFPVVRVALDDRVDARLEVLEHIAAGAHAGLPVHRAVVLGRADRQVVVADQEREVGVAARQRDHDGVLAIRLHVGDRRDDALGGGLGVLATVVVQRCDDVGCFQRLAVVELHAGAQLECPLGGIGRRFPALGQFGNQIALLRDLGEVVAKLTGADVDHVGIKRLGGIEHVAAAATGQALLEGSALLRRGRMGLVEVGRRQGHRHAGRGRLVDEIATADAPVAADFLKNGLVAHCGLHRVCLAVPALSCPVEAAPRSPLLPGDLSPSCLLYRATEEAAPPLPSDLSLCLSNAGSAQRSFKAS